MPKAPVFEPWLPREVVIPDYEIAFVKNPYTGRAFVSFNLTYQEQFHLLLGSSHFTEIAIRGALSYARTNDDRLR